MGDRLLKRQQRPDRGNILCFSEGTTVNDRYLISFRSGAFISGEPVQPVVLRYPFMWTSPMFGESTVATIMKLTSAMYWRMEVTYLPRYDPSAEEKANPKLYAENVRKAMAAAMNDPPVQIRDITNTELLKYFS